MDTLRFLLERRGDIAAQTLEHLFLVAVSIAIAVLIGIPLGHPPDAETGARFSGDRIREVLMQTVPSLALFGFLIPIPFIGGIGNTTAIVALVHLRASSTPEKHLRGHPVGRAFGRRGRDADWA